MLSHDWPSDIANHGNTDLLLRLKPFLAQEIQNNTLGSYPAEFLLKKLKPLFWFSGHMHVKFAALYEHADAETDQETRFLALGKCVPNQEFMQVRFQSYLVRF